MLLLYLIALAVGVFVLFGLHTVQTGYVGVYWRGGALLNVTSRPGFHVKIPLVTAMAQIQTSVQTDRVTNIPCGTSGGVILEFEAIEVVNRLAENRALETVRKYGIDYDKIWIFDKINHEINQFCSAHSLQEVYIDEFDTLDESLALALQKDCDKWETGIQIIATRVTKPKIPPAVAKNYELMEVEKTKLAIEVQRQRVVAKTAETERLVALIEASSGGEVSKITMHTNVLEAQANQKIQTIEDETRLARLRSKSDSAAYTKQRLAEANMLKFTPSYIEHKMYLSLESQPKRFYGKKLADMYSNFIEALAFPSGGSNATQCAAGDCEAKFSGI